MKRPKILIVTHCCRHLFRRVSPLLVAADAAAAAEGGDARAAALLCDWLEASSSSSASSAPIPAASGGGGGGARAATAPLLSGGGARGENSKNNRVLLLNARRVHGVDAALTQRCGARVTCGRRFACGRARGRKAMLPPTARARGAAFDAACLLMPEVREARAGHAARRLTPRA